MHFQGDKRRSFSRGEGCRECFDTGFQGRKGIYEVLPCEGELRSLIARDPSLDSIRQWQVEQGHQSLLDGGLRLAELEETSLEEVARVAFFE